MASVDHRLDREAVSTVTLRGRVSRDKVEQVFAGIVILTAFITSVLWGLLTPFNSAPDEESHFNMDWYIAVHNGLPIFDRSLGIHHTECSSPTGPCYASYASQPPGRPLLGAALMKVAHGITGRPYSTMMNVSRLASALCIAIYVFFLYLIARALIPDPFVRLTALMIGAFIPEVSFVGGYANDDTSGMAAAPAVIYLSILVLRNGLRRKTALVSGIALGLLALAKIDYYIVALIFVACLGIRLDYEWRFGDVRQFFRQTGLVVAVAAAISGWWFVRGIVLYHDPTGLLVWHRAIERLAPGYYSSTYGAQGFTVFTMLADPIYLQPSFRSFWAGFGAMNLWLPDTVYTWIRWMVLACGAGAVLATVRYLVSHRGIPSDNRWRAEIWCLLIGLLILSIWQSVWNSLNAGFEPQGRYLFPALVPVACLLAVGAQGWLGSRLYRKLVFLTVGLTMLCFNIYCLVFVNVPAYYSW